MINPMDLTGKLVLVTGGSSGIGREICIFCSRLGARIAMIARREDKLSETLGLMEGFGHTYYSFDLSDIEGTDALVSRLVDENGRLDGFVHCAGVSPSRPVKMLDHANLHNVMKINFYSFIELVRAVSKMKNFNPGLSIIGISSIASVTCKPGQTAYSASKAAMNAAMKCMALELSSKKIRINSILPGMIATEMWELYKATYNRDEGYYRTGGALGVGGPDDVANMAAFLLSDAAKFITRDEIHVAGGYHGQID